MKTFVVSCGRAVIRGCGRAVLFCLLVCFGAMCGSVSGALYGFETGKEGWQAGSWDPGITNAEQSAFWGYGGSDHSLRLDCDLVNSGDNGSAGVTFAAEDLEGTTITMRVYCPAGASGTHGHEWAWTRLRLWVKDGNFGYQETDWDTFPIPPGVSIQTVTHTVSSAGGFQATNMTEFGLQICWRGYGTYNGPLYVDAAGYGDPYQSSSFIAPSNEVFSFDVDDEGFGIQTWHDSLAVTNLAQVTGAPDNTTGCLRADVHLVEGHTNFSKGEVFVDMRNEQPFGMTIPANLHGRSVSARPSGQ